MQKSPKNKATNIILGLLVVVIIGYIYVQSGASFSVDENSVTEKIVFDGVPKNYIECMRTEDVYRFQDADRSMLTCSYTVYPKEIPDIDTEAVDTIKYDECLKQKNVPMSYAGDCSLVFYNPDYTFPRSFRECVDENKGEVTTTSSGSRCEIVIQVLTATNVDVANTLIDTCTSLGGDYSEEFGGQCHLGFGESSQ